jgi:hypothetical protein
VFDGTLEPAWGHTKIQRKGGEQTDEPEASLNEGGAPRQEDFSHTSGRTG